jgi:hypothetical protein
VTDSYFQTKRREQLAAMRAEFEGVQKALQTIPEFVRHESRHPGRIEMFMEQAAHELDDAERMISAMKGPPTKAWWVSFRKALELADKYMLMASNDHAVIRDGERQAGTEKPRFPECNEWIDDQLRRQPDAKSPELWSRAPDWITEDRPIPGKDTSRRTLSYDSFARRVTAGRGRLGLKRKKTTSSN